MRPEETPPARLHRVRRRALRQPHQLAYVLTGDQHTAEGLLQTALAKTATHRRGIRDSPEAYVRRVMYREQVGRWRSPRWGRERVVHTPPDQVTGDRTREVETRLTRRSPSPPTGRGTRSSGR
ncbi:hypothetical protein ACFXJ8_12645 [Nonomuraea sp. NPDC059194]|uniref:hypothetical protein n=1 Tax=Nonomuraea sp. NPDC059194 TaxID=3346764 RepID=UPI0036C960D6